MPQLAGMNHQHQAHHDCGCERKAQNVVTQLFGGCVEAEPEYKPKATPHTFSAAKLKLPAQPMKDTAPEAPASVTLEQFFNHFFGVATAPQYSQYTQAKPQYTQAAPLNLDVLRRQIALEERACIVHEQEELQALRANEARKAQAAQAHEAQAMDVRDVRKAQQIARDVEHSQALVPMGNMPVRLFPSSATPSTECRNWQWADTTMVISTEQQVNTVNLENILTQLFGWPRQE
ncbi:hypothetical protein B0H14DRAFT_3499037 [Mycena olivaceomarginata]|nr:hypothetical protein B0H14DRAFT_3499037 [Mycena olivaceomarginata]